MKSPAPVLTCEDLLAYNREEFRRWQRWFQENPAALGVTFEIAGGKTALELLRHITVVDLRYSERLLDQSITAWEAAPMGPAQELFAIGERAFANLETFLKRASHEQWSEVITFPTRSLGTLKGSRRKIFLHTLLHAMRHWAQMATALRSAGHAQDWQHDFLFTEVME